MIKLAIIFLQVIKASKPLFVNKFTRKLLGFASRSLQNVILSVAWQYVPLFYLVTVRLFILVPAVNVSSLPGLSRAFFFYFFRI